jgi:catechol 2,3-dioxygenase-like lactoylglutathione lyase family enzyme
MIHHIDIAVTELARSREFYERALAPLGLGVAITFTNHAGRQLVGFGSLIDPEFWIRDGEPIVGRVHVAFLVSSREIVRAFHAAAMQAGGKDNGPPGLRPRYGEDWYAAFVLDPDGHNIEALCRHAEPNNVLQATCETHAPER